VVVEKELSEKKCETINKRTHLFGIPAKGPNANFKGEGHLQKWDEWGVWWDVKKM